MGQSVTTLAGSAAAGAGGDGAYEFKNNLDMGAYKAQISAPGYQDVPIDFVVLKNGILKLPDVININIARNQAEKSRWSRSSISPT